MKKILFLSPYPLNKAPSQRLKYEQYYKQFEAAGYLIKTKSFVNEEFWKIIYKEGFTIQKVLFTLRGYFSRFITLLSLRKYDLVYVHLWVTPLGLPIFEWLVSKLSKKLIYDIDDLIYLGQTTYANRLISAFKGRMKPILLMKHADYVIVCTPKLEQFTRNYNDKVTDISSTIDTDKYIPISNHNKTKITLGWSGSHSTSKYLKLVSPILKDLQNRYDINILVIGDKGFCIDGLIIQAIEWNASSEVEDLNRIDIGLYPLPDEEWVFGKSGLKALQYMALEIPTVATKIGANLRVIEDGISGYLVSEENEWINRLELLIKDKELRKKIGKKARERVLKLYSIKSNTSTYLDILESVLSS